jgi:hypothetical protein
MSTPRIPKNEAIKLVDLLGLEREWEITFGGHADDPEFSARTHIEEEYHVARMETGAGWPTHNPEEQRKVLIHELMHVMLSDIRATSERGFDQLGEQAAQLMKDTLSREEELLCDRLAKALAKAIAADARPALDCDPEEECECEKQLEWGTEPEDEDEDEAAA